MAWRQHHTGPTLGGVGLSFLTAVELLPCAVAKDMVPLEMMSNVCRKNGIVDGNLGLLGLSERGIFAKPKQADQTNAMSLYDSPYLCAAGTCVCPREPCSHAAQKHRHQTKGRVGRGCLMAVGWLCVWSQIKSLFLLGVSQLWGLRFLLVHEPFSSSTQPTGTWVSTACSLVW